MTLLLALLPSMLIILAARFKWPDDITWKEFAVCLVAVAMVGWLNPAWPLVCITCSTRAHESRTK